MEDRAKDGEVWNTHRKLKGGQLASSNSHTEVEVKLHIDCRGRRNQEYQDTQKPRQKKFSKSRKLMYREKKCI